METVSLEIKKEVLTCFMCLILFCFQLYWDITDIQRCVSSRCATWWFETHTLWWAFHVALVVKNTPANAREVRDAGSVPASGRSPGGGHGNPFQCSRLENSMDRGACWVTVHGVTKSRTQQSDWTQHILWSWWHSQDKLRILVCWFQFSLKGIHWKEGILNHQWNS